MTAREVDHVAEVLAVDRLSPSFVRAELGGDDLGSWESLAIPDESCVFRFPGDEPRASTGERTGRWYTIRALDPVRGRLTVDFMIHPGGFGGSWAMDARPGDRLRIRRQDSWYRPPADVGWQLLVGDVVSLPAFARIAEETGGRCPTRAIVEIADEGDRRPIAGAEVTWLHNPGMAVGDSVLGSALRELGLPDGPGYVYVAGEGATTRAIRAQLRDELDLPRNACTAIGYWAAPAARERQSSL